LPTNVDSSILGFAIASTPPCRPSPAKRELTERGAIAALAVDAAELTNFHHARGLNGRDGSDVMRADGTAGRALMLYGSNTQHVTETVSWPVLIVEA
jgi:hypothetical protein